MCICHPMQPNATTSKNVLILAVQPVYVLFCGCVFVPKITTHILCYSAKTRRDQGKKSRGRVEGKGNSALYNHQMHFTLNVIQEKAESLQKLLQGRKKKRKKRNEEVEEEEPTWMQQHWKSLTIAVLLILCSVTALTVYMLT